MITFYEIGGVWLSNEAFPYSVNGKPKPAGSQFWGASWVTFDEKPLTVETVKRDSPVRHFVDQDGNTMAPSDYYDKLKSHVDEDGDYKSLEDEFEYRKFRDAWTAVKEDVETREPVEFTIIQLDTKGLEIPPYCCPVRLAQFKPDIPNIALYTYNPNRLDLCIKIANEYGITYCGRTPTKGMNWSIPEHSHKDLQFIQLDTRYMDYTRLKAIRSAIGTIEECVKAHQFNVELLRSFWEVSIATVSPKQLTDVQIQEVMTFANSIARALNEYESAKNKDKPDQIRRCREIVQNLKSRLGLAAKSEGQIG